MNTNKTIKIAVLSLLINIAYAAVNVALGLISPSAWFVTMGAYYLVLAVVRFVALISSKKEENPFLLGFSSVLFMTLSLPLIGMVILSSARERGMELHEILMITMALYAFTKVTLAIINLCEARKYKSDAVKVMRCVSFADALVPIASLQRSMLLSFGDMAEADIRLFNILTGSGVCVIVFILGLLLNKKKKYKDLVSRSFLF